MRSPLLFAATIAFGAAASLSAQSALHFGLPFGPHAVGFATVDQYDYSRTMADRFDDQGKPRGGEAARPIQTSIWYPAAAGGARMSYREYVALSVRPGFFPARDAAAQRLAIESLTGHFVVTDSARQRRELDASMHAVRNAAHETGRYPVVIYGPSFNAPSFENATLMEYLASYGYIVISSPSMGASGSMTADYAGMESQARDMEFLAAYARSVPGADVTHLGVMGFSWGGISNVLMSLRNPSVGALVTLDGSIAYFYHALFEKAPFASGVPLTVPALFLKQREPDAAMTAQLGADSVFDFFSGIHNAEAYRVDLRTLGHQNFGEWFDRLSQKGSPYFVVDTAVQGAGYQRIALYARNFLDAHLKNSADGRAFLALSPAENGFPASELSIERTVAAAPPPASIGGFANLLMRRHLPMSEAPGIFAELRMAHPGWLLPEGEVDAWGSRLAKAGKLDDAIGVLRMNIAMYPASSGAFASLGGAYLRRGDKTSAAASYQRAVEVDSTNAAAADALRTLRAKP